MYILSHHSTTHPRAFHGYYIPKQRPRSQKRGLVGDFNNYDDIQEMDGEKSHIMIDFICTLPSAPSKTTANTQFQTRNVLFLLQHWQSNWAGGMCSVWCTYSDWQSKGNGTGDSRICLSNILYRAPTFGGVMAQQRRG